LSSQTISLPAAAARPSRPKQFLALLPGTLLLFAIGIAGKGLESLGVYLGERHIPFPHVEYVLWAIILGLIISNFLRRAAHLPPRRRHLRALAQARHRPGRRQVSQQSVLHIGGLSLLLVFIELILSLSVMTLLGRIFRLPPKLTSLLAIGSSICGVTAIMAAQGAIEPEEEDTSTAIAAILTLGAIALFTFPAIGHLLHMGQQAYGIWAGLAVDNTAESIVTGQLYGQEAGRFAILAKTARSSFIGFVVLGYAVYWASKGQAAHVANKGLFLWQKFPKFILGFLASPSSRPSASSPAGSSPASPTSRAGPSFPRSPVSACAPTCATS
jgi:uncharacterized membrane protein YadS